MQMIKQNIRTCEFKEKHSASFQEKHRLPPTRIMAGTSILEDQ